MNLTRHDVYNSNNNLNNEGIVFPLQHAHNLFFGLKWKKIHHMPTRNFNEKGKFIKCVATHKFHF